MADFSRFRMGLGHHGADLILWSVALEEEHKFLA
jgi:hypothetical protein